MCIHEAPQDQLSNRPPPVSAARAQGPLGGEGPRKAELGRALPAPVSPALLGMPEILPFSPKHPFSFLACGSWYLTYLWRPRWEWVHQSLSGSRGDGVRQLEDSETPEMGRSQGLANWLIFILWSSAYEHLPSSTARVPWVQDSVLLSLSTTSLLVSFPPSHVSHLKGLYNDTLSSQANWEG